MKESTKTILVLVASFLCLAMFFLGIFLATGSYNIFKPGINTNFAPSYSELDFKRIRVGMDTSEVFRLIGNPLHRYASTWSYSEEGKRERVYFAWLVREISLYEGKVVQIADSVKFEE